MFASAAANVFDPFTDPVYMKARHLLLEPLEKVLQGFIDNNDPAITSELVVNFLNEIHLHHNETGKNTLNHVANNLARKERYEKLSPRENFLLALLDPPSDQEDSNVFDFIVSKSEERLTEAAKMLIDARFVLESRTKKVTDAKLEEIPDTVKKGSLLALVDAARKDKELALAYYIRAFSEGSAIGAVEVTPHLLFEDHYLTKAAERGHWIGLAFLGKDYEKTDVVKAAAYYRLAALGYKNCRFRNSPDETNATPAFELSKLAEKNPNNPQVQYFYFMYFLLTPTLLDKTEDLACLQLFKTFLNNNHALFCQMLRLETEHTRELLLDYLLTRDKDCHNSIVVGLLKTNTAKMDSKTNLASGVSAFAAHLRHDSPLRAKKDFMDVNQFSREQQKAWCSLLFIMTDQPWKIVTENNQTKLRSEKSNLQNLDVNKLMGVVTLSEENGFYCISQINHQLLNNLYSVGALVKKPSLTL